MLIMLQDKADTTTMNIVSDQATSLLALNDELREQISALFGQQSQALATLAIEREEGDAALGARLDSIEAALALSRGGTRQSQKKTAIKLPMSMKLTSSEAAPMLVAPAPSANLLPHVNATGASPRGAPEAEDPPPEATQSPRKSPDCTPNECIAERMVETSSVTNIVDDTETIPKSTPFTNLSEDAAAGATLVPGKPDPRNGRIGAAVDASVDQAVPLVSYLQSPPLTTKLRQASQREKLAPPPPTQHVVRPSPRMREDKQQAMTTIRCLSCDAPSVKPGAQVSPHGRTFGGGFKFGA